ncbi:hypothetical protein SEPCBS119000_000344 [Sporothrix epigloea]|uniref:Uncharacterized protein n=1 Tax=Sporothrix epigloea TaxID=1892477 RepID=A0ABP0D504_9PEZI
MCRGVVTVYGCQHKEVSQVHMCQTAYASQNGSGAWASLVYCFTRVEPRRKCGQTVTERRFVDEPCLLCSRAPSRPQSLPDSSRSGNPLSVRPHPPLSNAVAPRAYKPEPTLTGAQSSSPSTATGKNGKEKVSAPNPGRSGNALLASVPSSSRAVPPPKALTSPSSARRATPPVRPRRPAFSEPFEVPLPVRPPRPPPSLLPLPLTGPPRMAHSRSNSLPVASSSRGTPQQARSRPAVATSSSQSLRRYDSPTTQSRLRSSAATPQRPSPLPLRPVTTGITSGRTSSSRAQKLEKGKGSSAKSSATPTRKVAHVGLVSRISSALRTAKSTESFACVEAHRIERGEREERRGQ